MASLGSKDLGSREREISEHGTATQAGYLHHLATAVSFSNIPPTHMQSLLFTHMQVHTVSTKALLHLDHSNREREISESGTATQADYLHHLATAVSFSNIPPTHSPYYSHIIMQVHTVSTKALLHQQQGKRN